MLNLKLWANLCDYHAGRVATAVRPVEMGITPQGGKCDVDFCSTKSYKLYRVFVPIGTDGTILQDEHGGVWAINSAICAIPMPAECFKPASGADKPQKATSERTL